jgi:hypothetical protein
MRIPNTAKLENSRWVVLFLLTIRVLFDELSKGYRGSKNVSNQFAYFLPFSLCQHAQRTAKVTYICYIWIKNNEDEHIFVAVFGIGSTPPPP